MRVSVVIVSRHRPALLRRCLLGLTQQDLPGFEVVVVADPAGIAMAEGFAVKRLAFDEPNISAARNLGLVQAAGDVVAFIDDDAVPEPTWLSRLTAPFADGQVIAATGFIRGRNGISFQWRAAWVDAEGHDLPMAVDSVTLLSSTRAKAVKTQGTNCAFRRETLAGAGGFDPAFQFFHDETDLNLRLAGHGLTAIVPDAQVHHGFAEGPHRRADRVPKSLHEIAASTAVFLRRHAGGATDQHLADLTARERRRTLGHMVAGRIEPRDVTHLTAGLRAGWADGLSRALTDLPPLPPPQAAFLPLHGPGPRQGLVLSGWRHQAPALEAQARAAVAQGRIVTLLLFSRDARPHWHGFGMDGVWRQTGGLFGPADRGEAPFRLWRMTQRRDHEITRLCRLRATE
ncbi:MAG: glycosyl transferase [Rhodobacteraceae bacterium PARR1]|nr:MAG: glycosyl transferase [Rhodobacteraceae bacterium PARR1]